MLQYSRGPAGSATGDYMRDSRQRKAVRVFRDEEAWRRLQSSIKKLYAPFGMKQAHTLTTLPPTERLLFFHILLKHRAIEISALSAIEPLRKMAQSIFYYYSCSFKYELSCYRFVKAKIAWNMLCPERCRSRYFAGVLKAHVNNITHFSVFANQERSKTFDWAIDVSAHAQKDTRKGTAMNGRKTFPWVALCCQLQQRKKIRV